MGGNSREERGRKGDGAFARGRGKERVLAGGRATFGPPLQHRPYQGRNMNGEKAFRGYRMRGKEGGGFRFWGPVGNSTNLEMLALFCFEFHLIEARPVFAGEVE